MYKAIGKLFTHTKVIQWSKDYQSLPTSASTHQRTPGTAQDLRQTNFCLHPPATTRHRRKPPTTALLPPFSFLPPWIQKRFRLWNTSNSPRIMVLCEFLFLIL